MLPTGPDCSDGKRHTGKTESHVAKDSRAKVLQECVRTMKADALLCVFEPNQNCIKIIKELDPSHPEVADPNENAGGLGLESRTIEGKMFDAFIFKK